MNGAHDLGGKHGFGKIDRSQTANFSAQWEERVFALTLACGMLGRWNLDQSRSAREQMDPAHYLNSSYYEHWLSGLEQLLVEQKLVTAEELESGLSQSTPEIEAVDPTRMQQILSVGGPTLIESARDPAFAIGDKVVVVMDHPLSHTRAPGYTKGKTGTIVAHHGAHIYADQHALNGQKVAEHLYGVRFEATALWGARREAQGGAKVNRNTAEQNTGHACSHDSGDKNTGNREPVFVDLFEPYLQTVTEFKKQLGA
jgi:nitrile hydratase